MNKLKPLYVEDRSVPSNCGIGYLAYFSYTYDRYSDHLEFENFVDRIPERKEGGCGWYITGFVNSPQCKDLHERLMKEYLLIYQSEVRTNENTGNDFFFCIFDTRNKPQKTGDWPLPRKEE